MGLSVGNVAEEGTGPQLLHPVLAADLGQDVPHCPGCLCSCTVRFNNANSRYLMEQQWPSAASWSEPPASPRPVDKLTTIK